MPADSQPSSRAGEDRDGQRRADSWGNPDNFLAAEEAPVPDMWLVDELGSMSDWQRRKLANATDAETFELLVERYGADTMEGTAMNDMRKHNRTALFAAVAALTCPLPVVGLWDAMRGVVRRKTMLALRMERS